MGVRGPPKLGSSIPQGSAHTGAGRVSRGLAGLRVPGQRSSRARRIPLHTNRLAPIGRLQQAELQADRRLQDTPQEVASMEHSHTDHGGVHHWVLRKSEETPPKPDAAITSRAFLALLPLGGVGPGVQRCLKNWVPKA